MKKPKQHQVIAIRNARDHFRTNQRGQLHMACGTGKTLTSLWIAQELKAKKIVIILPSLQLQEQSLNTWMQDAMFFDFDMLAIGSDKSFSRKYNVHTTTSVDVITKFLKQPSSCLVFCTYQSFDRLLDACDENTYFDFGIIDEAHNTAGHNEKKYSRLLLQQDKLPIEKLLFMTGTPKFYEGSSFISMDDNEVFGKVIYTLTTEEAIEQNILSDYKLLVMYISEPDLINEDNRQDLIQIKDSSIPINYLALKYYVDKAIAKYDIKKMLSFHNSKLRAEKFSKLLNGENIFSYSVNSSQNVSKRIELVKKYSLDNVSCICNPRIMIEGFDLPQIDSILFADIKYSKQDLIQAIGRALRKYINKEISYILLPIFVNKDGVINKKDYATYCELLASVAISDNRIFKYFAFGHNDTNGESPLVAITNNNELVDKLHKSLSVRVWKKIEPTNFVSFDEFKSVLLHFNITSIFQFKKFHDSCHGKLDSGKMIPKRPNRFYTEWQSWSEIFGYQTEPIIGFIDFKNLMQQYDKEYGISNSKLYYAWAYNRKNFGIPFPPNLPRYPYNFYIEWTNWYDIFKKEKKQILSFDEFKIEIQKYKPLLEKNYEKSYLEWSKGKLNTLEIFPNNFPNAPQKAYTDWQGWHNLFGIQKKEMVSYEIFSEQMADYSLKHDIDSARNYYNWATKIDFLSIPFPTDFPLNPNKYYKEKWVSWPHLFCKKKLNYTEFKEKLKFFIEKYNLESGTQYLKWATGKVDLKVKFPKNFPNYPNEAYPEWEGWPKIFNREKIFLSYNEFEVFINYYNRNFGINTATKFKKWARKEMNIGVEFPNFLPKEPECYYKEWQGWKTIYSPN